LELGELTALPRPSLAGFKGPNSKGKGRERKEGYEVRVGKKGREGKKGEGGKGKGGKGREESAWPLLKIFRRP